MARRAVRIAVIASLGIIAAAPARADAIDGDWCYSSTSFRIEGPAITTPGGNRLQGRYARHDFDYVVPAGEAEAGSHVRMRLIDEETLSLTRVPPAGAAAPAEIWKRCKPIS